MSFILILGPTAGESDTRQTDRDVNYSIDLEDKVVSADVSSPQGGYVSINGTVTLTRETDVTVYLESYVVSNAWTCTVTPDTLEFSKDGSAHLDFVLEVWIPHGVPHDVSDIVQVNGSWELFSSITGSIPPDQAAINVLQFSALEIGPADPEQPYIDLDNRYETLVFPLVFKRRRKRA